MNFNTDFIYAQTALCKFQQALMHTENPAFVLEQV